MKETAKIKDALKELIRRRNLKYSDVAERLDCSLPTVNRILGREELGLSRLLELCNWLGISLADLDRFGDQISAAKRVYFTEEQELLLVGNKKLLRVMDLLFEGYDRPRISAHLKLTSKQLDRLLRDLETAKLIRISSRGRVKPVGRRMPEWLPRGPLAKEYFQANFDNFVGLFNDVIQDKFRNDGKYYPESRITLKFRKISRKAFAAWNAELSEKLEEIDHKAHLDCRFGAESELVTVAIVAGATHVPLESEWIDRLSPV